MWESPDTKKPVGFQLIYNKGPKAFALTLWPTSSEIVHQKYDDGESRPGKPKYSPMLFQTLEPVPASLLATFEQAASSIDSIILGYLKESLLKVNKKSV